jgi:aerobic carbon-monoxide dehydrogenase medium subunit
VPMMALRLVYPPALIDINAIPRLDQVVCNDGHLCIGATARHASFHRPSVANGLGRLLAVVSRHIAHYPIRLRGTFCGSLAHADPASEWCLVAATLGGEVVLVRKGGHRRVVSAAEFLRGAMVTAREPNEIVVEARLPLFSRNATFGFYEFNRRAGDFALGMCLATFSNTDGLMSDVRVGLGGIEGTSRRLFAVEKILEGRAVSVELFREAAAVAADGLQPMEDAATSADYRRDLTPVVVRRALQIAAKGLGATI